MYVGNMAGSNVWGSNVCREYGGPMYIGNMGV